ncbi:Rrf2 family transcriptional regulator [Streptomyces sp. NPDC001070]
MSANSRMTIAVHVLTWMSLDRQNNEVATSERIAGSVNTNPVVIRRCLGDLRRAGLVESRRGAGAGWVLAREPAEITLLEVYLAVEGGGLFGMHSTPPNSECSVGFGIQPALQRVYSGLESQMQQELSQTTIAGVLRDVLAQQR